MLHIKLSVILITKKFVFFETNLNGKDRVNVYFSKYSLLGIMDNMFILVDDSLRDIFYSKKVGL